MKTTKIILALAVSLTLPLGAVAEGSSITRARSTLETMKQVVRQIELLAKDTTDDAVKQTCIVGAHQEMSDILSSVEKGLDEAAGKGAEVEAAALERVQASAGTIDQLRSEVYDCVGAEDLAEPGGRAASRGYDAIKSSREEATVSTPMVRPPGPTQRPPAASPTK